MNDVRLFKDSNGIWYTTKDILEKLKEVGLMNAIPYLYIRTLHLAL